MVEISMFTRMPVQREDGRNFDGHAYACATVGFEMTQALILQGNKIKINSPDVHR